MKAQAAGVGHAAPPVAKKNQSGSANGVKVGVRNGTAVTMCNFFISVWSASATMMKTLHMVTADPFRTPTFTPFADPDWFFFATGGATPAVCATPADCATIPARTSQSVAWNHGDIHDEIASTWVGFVGPGIENHHQYGAVWTDHTDVRPTMLSVLGLADDYQTDGRAVTEILNEAAIPTSLRLHQGTMENLGAVYKQLTAPFGTFGQYTLKASTRALASNAAADATYTLIEDSIASLTSQRDTLAANIRTGLNNAEFGDTKLDENQLKDWITSAQDLIDQAVALGS